MICTYGGDAAGSVFSPMEKLPWYGIRREADRLCWNTFTPEISSESPLSVFSSKTDIIQVVCSKTCCVEFIDYYHLTKRCPRACSFHSTLVSNALHLLSLKAVHLSERLDILSQRTIREKLLRCFTLMAADQQASCSFTLPFSLGTLADYLCVDRSAMMREIGKMKKEGLLQMDKRQITLSDPIFHKEH